MASKRSATAITRWALAGTSLCLAACAPASSGQQSGHDRSGTAPPADAPVIMVDDFARKCVSPCSGSIWATTQEIQGRVAVAERLAGRNGVLDAHAGPRRSKVPKADLIHRMAPVAAGGRIVISFALFVPQGTPLNSIHLLDLECATCGVSGNPGIRLYFRHGRLRIDRAKIGEEHAWTNEQAKPLQAGRWYTIGVAVGVGSIESGSVVVKVDGDEVLNARGRTLLNQSNAHIDRIQFGITASSNTIPVRVLFDDFSATVFR